MLKTKYKNIAIGALQSKIHNLFHSLSRKCIQKMSAESLFWKSSPKNVSRKVEKSGDKNLLSRFFRLFRRRNSESKTLYRLVNQLDWLFILPPKMLSELGYIEAEISAVWPNRFSCWSKIAGKHFYRFKKYRLIKVQKIYANNFKIEYKFIIL